MMAAGPRLLSDLNAMVAGQGGDGSLTVISILAELLARRGFHLFMARDVASRIKGGLAAAMLRGSLDRRGCMGDHIDLLIAFGQDAVDAAGARMASDGIVIFDASDGPLSRAALPETVRVIEVPFGRFAVRDLRRDLFKNSLSFGVLSRVLRTGEDDAAACLRHTLRHLPDRLIDANLRAFRRGLDFADETGLAAGQGPWAVDLADRREQLLIGGNEAIAFGFLVAGGRFFAGYPITPATEILEWLTKYLPHFGGIAVQAEDELAAVNMTIGAAMTGTRAMTATSGPGCALMQEGIGHAGSAEIPIVVVDSQRAGPSTGMPTKPEQSDIGMLVHGGNGDFPRVVLSPGSPRDCFELAVLATNLSQKLQCPVIIALDQAVAQDSRTVDPLDLDSHRLEEGARPDADGLRRLEEYRRYRITPDGISPWVVPGTPGGMCLITGNERNEWGLVSTDPENRRKMVDKRARKIASISNDLPRGRFWGDPEAEIGVIGIGMQEGVIEEASERLIAAGHRVKCLQPRTLWPVLDETLDFIRSSQRVHVVEHNAGGQLARLLIAEGAPADRIGSILRYDGVPFRPGELCDRITEVETPGDAATTARRAGIVA